MKESFFLSVRAVVPMFLLVITGYTLRRINLIKAEIIKPINKLVFSVFLTSNLIKSLISADLSTSFSWQLSVYIVMAHLVMLIGLWWVVPRYIREKKRAGSFIQCVYRSNCVLIGFSICANLFGTAGASTMALNLAIMVPFYNIFSVILLTYFAGSDAEGGLSFSAILKSIVTNPLIISSFVGIFLSAFQIRLPEIIQEPLFDLADCSTPIAMLFIGAQFSFDHALSDIKIVSVACLLKLIILPLLFIVPAIVLGFRGEQLGALLFFLAAPTAASAAIQTEAMNCDGVLAGEIQLFSTFFSAFTLFLWIFSLLMLGLM